MKAQEMMRLIVVDIESGTTIGSATGILIDAEKKQIAALQLGGSLLSRPDYLPFGSVESIENDVLTIASSSVLVERGEFKTSRLVGSLDGRNVFTEDGKNLGTVHDYDVDSKNGDITFITVALDKAVMGGLLRYCGERFDISRSLIITLGDSVIVDSSVPDLLN